MLATWVAKFEGADLIVGAPLDLEYFAEAACTNLVVVCDVKVFRRISSLNLSFMEQLLVKECHRSLRSVPDFFELCLFLLYFFDVADAGLCDVDQCRFVSWAVGKSLLFVYVVEKCRDLVT